MERSTGICQGTAVVPTEIENPHLKKLGSREQPMAYRSTDHEYRNLLSLLDNRDEVLRVRLDTTPSAIGIIESVA